MGSIIGGIYRVCEGSCEIATSLVRDAKKLVTSTDGFDTSLRLWADSTVYRAIRNNTYNADSPLLQNIAASRSVISLLRWGWAVNELFDGSLARNIEEKKTFSVIASISFIVVRTLSVGKWAMDIGLFKAEELVHHLHKIGVGSFYTRAAMHPVATVLQRAPMIDSLFTVALSALAINNVKGLMQGENIGKNLLCLISLTADIAAMVLGISNKLSLQHAAILGIIATTAGIAEFFCPNQNA